MPDGVGIEDPIFISRGDKTGMEFSISLGLWVWGHPGANCSSTPSSGFFTGAYSFWISVYGSISAMVKYIKEAGKRGR